MNPDAVYETLYDLSLQAPPNPGWLEASAVALVIALAVLWRRRHRRAPVGVPGFFSAAFALMLFATGFSLWDHHRLGQALSEGRVAVVEGVLQSYDVQHRATYNSSSKRYDRSIAESFYVADVPFGFIRDASVAGYTNSGDKPLVFVQGEVLRVHYVEDTPGEFDSRRILRLQRRRGGEVAAARGQRLLGRVAGEEASTLAPTALMAWARRSCCGNPRRPGRRSRSNPARRRTRLRARTSAPACPAPPRRPAPARQPAAGAKNTRPATARRRPAPSRGRNGEGMSSAANLTTVPPGKAVIQRAGIKAD